jgi:glycerophosphoryl diester phosphodiesterase
MSGRLDWLIARPVAHRGLHDVKRGVIENTPSAFAAAIAGHYGIECDLQVSADGEAMVHHDDVLGRLTEGSARLDTMTAAALKRVPFKATAEHIMTLGELCELVGHRATLVIELKGRFEGDHRLARRVANTLSPHVGPAAVMSFDPIQIAVLRELAPALARGMVGESRSRYYQGALLSAARDATTYFARAVRARPQFIAYSVSDLPSPVPTVARKIFGLPLLAWTVRSTNERQTAARYADQIIFEGFRP